MKYSRDFAFFLKEQIGFSTTNNEKHTTFFSRLDGENFKVIDGDSKLSEDKIKEICKTIHSGLKYYSVLPIYEVTEYLMKDKTITLVKERPDLDILDKEKGTFINDAGGTETSTSRLKLTTTLPVGVDVVEDEGQKFLPYFADVTQDLPGSCRQFPPKEYKNCQLLKQKHGGYLEFFHHESEKTLRIAINSNIYEPVK